MTRITSNVKRPTPNEFDSLDAQSVTFAYSRTPLLQNISLTVNPGHITAIVGPNGCGKSTLLTLLAGQLRPQTGRIFLTNSLSSSPLPLTSFTPAQIATHIALVPQSHSIGFPYSVRQSVLMARWPHHQARSTGIATSLGFETPEDDAIAVQAMWTMDVHHLAERPITTLSGGERQRVVIARALAQQTSILLLDEPTAALDPCHQLELFDHLRHLTRQQSKTVVTITHDLNLALAYADQVIVMNTGRIVVAGPPSATLVPEVLEPVYQVKVKKTVDALIFTRQPGRSETS